jgi:hypothetical protein
MRIDNAELIGPNQIVNEQCIDNPDCNPMLSILPLLRVEALGICEENKLGVNCNGSRPGTLTPICGLNNLVKCALENRVNGNLHGDGQAVRAAAATIVDLTRSAV